MLIHQEHFEKVSNIFGMGVCAFFECGFLLTVESFLLTAELFCLQLTILVFTYSWSCFGYSLSLFTYTVGVFFAYSGKVHLIRALRDCKQRSLTVSNKAPTVRENFPPFLWSFIFCHALAVPTIVLTLAAQNRESRSARFPESRAWNRQKFRSEKRKNESNRKKVGSQKIDSESPFESHPLNAYSDFGIARFESHDSESLDSRFRIADSVPTIVLTARGLAKGAPGPKKLKTESKKSQNRLFFNYFDSFSTPFSTFWAPGPRGRGNSFSDSFSNFGPRGPK